MPTETQIKDAIGQGFFVMDFLRTEGGMGSDNFIQRVGEFVQYVGAGRFERGGIALTAMAGVRGSYSSAVEGAKAWLAPLMREYMDVLDLPTFGLQQDAKSLYDDYVRNGKRVESRQFTFDTVHASGSPVGSGTIYRCTKDENGFDLENTFAQTVTLECVFDQNNGGVKFKESFQFKGGSANIDNIVIAGSGSDETYPGISSDDSSSYFQNCSFSQANGGATVSKFDFWTLDVDSLAAWVQDTTESYQTTPGDPIAASLKITGNGNIYQNFGTVQFPQNQPMFVRLPIKFSGVNAGAFIRMRFGEQVKDYTVGGAESGWLVAPLTLEFTDRSWYKKFAINSGQIRLEVHGMTTGTIWVDNWIVCPAINFDGLWYVPCAGATPFKVGDRYYFTDTANDANAIIQRFFVQHTGVALPSDTNASAITWADPIYHT